jgi:DNA-binding CsgD family transcriptional regulator/sugar-specific transcriptional regulator TrmB
MLDRLGLDEPAFAIYHMLLRNSEFDIGDLCEELQISPETAMAAMSDLKRLALVRPSWDEPGKLYPVNPEIGLRALIDDQEAMLADRRREIEQARLAVARFAAEHAHWRAVRNGVDIECLDGIDAIRNRIDELAASARSEIAAFSMGIQSSDTIEAGRLVDQDALERGLRLRSIYLQSIQNHPPSKAHAQWLVEQGAEVRTAPILPLRMVIFDRSTALLPVDPELSRAGAVLLSGKGPLTALLHLFEQTWEMAIPLGDPAPPVAGEGFDDTDRTVVKLLGEGLTDEAVARKLGVSLRTVRRMMARLMRQLGTKSRFETGVSAARLGLL